MRARYLLALVTSLVAIAPHVAAQPHTAQVSDLFTQFCAPCHGETGTGGHMGGPSLVADKTRTLTNAVIFETIRLGRPDKGMPAFDTRLKPPEIASLTENVRQLQGIKIEPGSATENPADALSTVLSQTELEAIARGREVFEGRGRCSECHSIAIDGGRVAPDLTGVAKRMNQTQLRNAIVNPSLLIARGYEVREIVTNDGTRIRGWSRSAAPGTVQLFDPDEELWTTYFIPDLQSNLAINESLMPGNLLDGLTDEENQDLMAFLDSLK